MPETWVQYDKELPYIEDRQPWEVPTSYMQKTATNQYEVVKGRRKSNMLLVNKLRAEIDQWRENAYPGATKTTVELLTFWFEQSHQPVFGNEPFNFYFCQREAIETLIYLFEIKQYDDLEPLLKEFSDVYTDTLFASEVEITEDLEGNRRVKRYFPELKQEGEQDLPEQYLLRYAVKMATGSGKTMVMALAIVWSYFNRLKENNRRYADNFLVIAPNVIVYERLAKDFANNKLFIEFPFIPDSWKPLWKPNVKLRGDESPLSPSGNIIVNNIHQLYESRTREWKPETIIQSILGREPQKDPTKPPQTLLERVKELDNLMVLNDEAHHVHDDELKWNESLLSVHNSIPGGLMNWLDFSATPKTPAGTYYPWIICDYPLAQAVEDRIVKTPLIVHTVQAGEPVGVKKANVVAKYTNWITAALKRWKEHYDAFKQVDKKAVLFIMAEKNAYADEIAKSIKRRGPRYGITKDEEILTIHTDNTGDVRKSDLDKLREDARDVDRPDNEVKVIVSVLMLREGWDVQNVTIVLGLRAFASSILPEQAIGRGLRLMRNISPDRTQTLEVIGNDNFEEIVRLLENEGVGINTTKTPPPLPITIAPEKKRLQYDIEIPATDFSYLRLYKKISELDPLTFPSLYTSDKLDEDKKILLKMEMLQLGVEVHQAVIESEYLPLGQELVSRITNEVMRKARLTDCFNILYPIVCDYILKRAFDVEIKDIEVEELRKQLREDDVHEALSDLLAAEVGKTTVERKEVKIKAKTIKLSETPKFTWRRKHLKCKKTVFNFVASYNPFESDFAVFLDKSDDMKAFAALAGTPFQIDYLTSKGAIRYYFPDFVAFQEVDGKEVYWILETKGREYPELENKNKAIERWCKSVSQQTGQQWKYMLVRQYWFDRYRKSFKNLGTMIKVINEAEEKAKLL